VGSLIGIQNLMGHVTHVGKMGKQHVKFTLDQATKAQRGNR